MLSRSLVHPVDFDFGEGAKMDCKLFLANPRNVALVNGQTKDLAREPWSGMEVLGLVVGFVVWSSIAALFIPSAHAYVMLRMADVSTAEARVVRAWTKSGEDVTYYFAYELLTEPGKEKVATEASVTSSCYSAHPVGSTLLVRYNRREPSISEPVEGNTNGLVGILFPLLFLIGAAGGGAASVLNTYRRKKLLDEFAVRGVLLQGVLTLCELETESEGEPMIRCDYLLTPPNSEPVRGSGWTDKTRFDDDNYPPAGTPVMVYYLDPERHLML
jgi:hypothetical protein